MTEQPNSISPNPTTTVPNATVHSGELSSGAQAGIGVGIGVGNVCCGPFCYCMPSFLATTVGIVLYFVWKNEKPKTAKNILMVTLITAGVALLIMSALFFLGMAGAILDELS